MQDIGKSIRNLRMQRKMTQDELAERLFVTRQTVSNYETGRSRPDVETLTAIAEVLETDINTLIYGLPKKQEAVLWKPLAVGCAITILLLLLQQVLAPLAMEYRRKTLNVVYTIWIPGLLNPLIWLCGGWTMMQLFTMALRKPLFPEKYAKILKRVLILILVFWLVITLFYLGVKCLDEYLYRNKLRGQWVDFHYLADGKPAVSKSWDRIPLPVPEWLDRFCTLVIWRVNLSIPWVLCFPGGLLMLCGFPGKRE